MPYIQAIWFHFGVWSHNRCLIGYGFCSRTSKVSDSMPISELFKDPLYVHTQFFMVVNTFSRAKQFKIGNL